MTDTADKHACQFNLRCKMLTHVRSARDLSGGHLERSGDQAREGACSSIVEDLEKVSLHGPGLTALRTIHQPSSVCGWHIHPPARAHCSTSYRALLIESGCLSLQLLQQLDIILIGGAKICQCTSHIRNMIVPAPTDTINICDMQKNVQKSWEPAV